MTLQRRFAPKGGRIETESLAGLTGIYTLIHVRVSGLYCFRGGRSLGGHPPSTQVDVRRGDRPGPIQKFALFPALGLLDAMGHPLLDDEVVVSGG